METFSIMADMRLPIIIAARRAPPGRAVSWFEPWKAGMARTPWLVKSRIDIPEDDQPARGRSLPQGSTQAQCLSGAQGVERIGFPLREGRRIFYGCPARLDRAGSVSRHRGPACCPGRLGSRRPRRIPRWELCPRQSEALV